MLGKPARQVTQADIDYVTQMMGGGAETDLTYDINRDGKIDQSDIDFMQGLVTGGGEGWSGEVGTAWGPTGLYGQQAEEAARIREQQRVLAQQQRLQGQRFQAQNILGGLMQQLPQAAQAAQPVSTPLYAESQYVDLSAPLQISPAQRHSMFDPARQNQQGPTKMASGGFLNGQGDPDTWDDILRMLGK